MTADADRHRTVEKNRFVPGQLPIPGHFTHLSYSDNCCYHITDIVDLPPVFQSIYQHVPHDCHILGGESGGEIV